jgi:hypothetical protein
MTQISWHLHHHECLKSHTQRVITLSTAAIFSGTVLQSGDGTWTYKNYGHSLLPSAPGSVSDTIFNTSVCSQRLNWTLPSTVVEMLTFLLRIQDVTVSNLSPKTGILTEVYRTVSKCLQTKARKVSQIRPRPLTITSFPIHNLTSSPLFDAI